MSTSKRITHTFVDAPVDASPPAFPKPWRTAPMQSMPGKRHTVVLRDLAPQFGVDWTTVRRAVVKLGIPTYKVRSVSGQRVLAADSDRLKPLYDYFQDRVPAQEVQS